MDKVFIPIYVEDYDLKLSEFICQDKGNSVIEGYYCSNELLLLDIIPYIVRNNVIIWNLPISKVTVGDFVNTFPECVEKGICCIQGFPMAGGPGRIAIHAAIDIAIVVVTSKYPELGITLEAAKIISESLQSLSKYYEENDITPKQQLDALLCCENVSKAAIKDILEYDDYHAIKFLKALGFYWDKKTESFRINDIDKPRARAYIKAMDDLERESCI